MFTGFIAAGLCMSFEILDMWEDGFKYSDTSVYVLNPFQILGLTKQDVYQTNFSHKK
jgi:hypothetical protein